MPHLDPEPVAPAPRRARPVDVAVTLLELVVLGVLSLYASFFGLFLGMGADACSDSSDCTDRVGVGVLIAVLAPWVCLAVAAAWSLVRRIRGRLAFWVPWVFVLAWAALVTVAVGIATPGTA